LADFDLPFARTLNFEGKMLENDSDDPGGMTYCGISRVFNGNWAGWVLVDAHLKASPDIHVASMLCNADQELFFLVMGFYRTQVWNRHNMGDLTYQELATQFYDAVVNLGDRATKALQGLLGVTTDGDFGQISVGAANAKADPSGLVDSFLEWRIQHYKDHAKPEYLNGLLKRCVRSDNAVPPQGAKTV